MMGVESSKECLLRTTECEVAGKPTIECTGCHFEADHFFWYEDDSYAYRKLYHCPRCGTRIIGIVVRA